MYSQVQSEGLQTQYVNDAATSLTIRMLPALAFVPPEHVVEAFETLQAVLPDEVAPISDYFEDTYIGRLRRGNQRAQPYFSVDIWNVFNRADNDLPRTNNAVEGYHKKLQSSTSCHHPNLWKFLDIIKGDIGINRVQIDQMLGGHVAPPPRKKYMDSNARILTIVNDFANRNILDYLRGIAHNISF